MTADPVGMLRERNVGFRSHVTTLADFTGRDNEPTNDMGVAGRQHFKSGRNIGAIGHEHHLINFTADRIVVELKSQAHSRPLLFET